jgi:hypothetical protein
MWLWKLEGVNTAVAEGVPGIAVEIIVSSIGGGLIDSSRPR